MKSIVAAAAAVVAVLASAPLAAQRAGTIFPFPVEAVTLEREADVAILPIDRVFQ
jgi:hypothetical protein